MLLTETEGKSLLATSGIRTPQAVLISKADSLAESEQKLEDLAFPAYVKAQVLHGNRQLEGLVKKALTAEEAQDIAAAFFMKTDSNKQPITMVSVEEEIIFEDSYYLSIRYDTRRRRPVIDFSKEGGAGMDDRGDTIVSQTISITEGLKRLEAFPEATTIAQQLFQTFLDNDAVLLEINPLVFDGNEWVCLDAKIELDSTAAFRHEEWKDFPKRSMMGRQPTETELKAKEVSRQDQRGVAGESFFEFPGGTIGVMASGGGASTLVMDALMAEGLKPANYTEYSGNPTREKVADLSRVVCAMPNLEALYIVGSTANFTDIYETLAGVLDGFLESPYAQQKDFVIIIRRGGPRWQEAFEMVTERLASTPVNYKLFGPDFPLVETATELKKALNATN